MGRDQEYMYTVHVLNMEPRAAEQQKLVRRKIGLRHFVALI